MTAEELIKALEHAAEYGMKKPPYVTLGMYPRQQGVCFTGYDRGHTFNHLVDWLQITSTKAPEKIVEYAIDRVRDKLTEDRD